MHKIIILLIAVLLMSVSPASADENLAIKLCLQHWPTHPFNSQNPRYRVIAAKVKIFGIGEDVYDRRVTNTPELILVKPNVSVISDAKMQLMNPNGWYCLHNKVNVIAKTEIVIHCDAKLTSTKDSFAIIAKDQEKQGVTVIGKNRIIRNCSSDSGVADSSSNKSYSNISYSRYDAEIARVAQYKLNTKGYNAGHPDGLWGTRSRTAMSEYQQDQGLEITGELNEQSLESLGLEGDTQVGSKTDDINKSSEKTSVSNEMTTQNKNEECSVKQILAMDEMGLSDEQIQAACGL